MKLKTHLQHFNYSAVSWWMFKSGSAILYYLKAQVSISFGAKPPCQDFHTSAVMSIVQAVAQPVLLHDGLTLLRHLVNVLPRLLFGDVLYHRQFRLHSCKVKGRGVSRDPQK